MSIVISNISESRGIDYLPHGKVGAQVYEVCLNKIPLVEFTHNTEDGMAECLIAAGKALKGVCIDGKIKDCNKRRLTRYVVNLVEEDK